MINSKSQRPECQKYRLWKKAQQVKSTVASKKVKKKSKSKKGPLDDCLESENNEEKEKAAPLQIDYEKCKERQKNRRRRARAALAKAIPILKQLEDRIQPPIALRDQWINQRHYPCLLERRPSIEHQKISGYAAAKKKVDRPEKSEDQKARSSESKDGANERDRKNATSAGSPSQQQILSDVEGAGTSGSEGEKTMRMKRSKKKVIYPYKPPYSGESECESICSFDSEICLAGLTLTAADKKELHKYQERDE